jgi:hypothetical protein
MSRATHFDGDLVCLLLAPRLALPIVHVHLDTGLYTDRMSKRSRVAIVQSRLTRALAPRPLPSSSGQERLLPVESNS